MNTACDWLFCCDGDDRSGLGHVGRCLGYAEMLADAGLTCAFQGSYGETAACMIEASGFTTLPVARLDPGRPPALALQPTQGVLLDSYDIDADSIAHLQKILLPERLVLLDDFAQYPRYDCAAVLNFTIGAPGYAYPTGDATLFLGPSFFPARRWLRRVRENRRQRELHEPVRQIFIVAGGRDLCSINATFMSLLGEKFSNCEIAILLGDDAGARAEVTPLMSRFPQVQLLPRLPDLEEWLLWADVCLCGGGLVKYECLYAGVPVASIAQNIGQWEDSQRLAREDLIADLGNGPDLRRDEIAPAFDRFMTDASWRDAMVQKGLLWVGGDAGIGGLRPFLAANAG